MMMMTQLIGMMMITVIMMVVFESQFVSGKRFMKINDYNQLGYLLSQISLLYRMYLLR